jgi:hypothetical protein
MSNLIHNERLKYAATFFNNVGVASFAVGGVLPMLTNANPPVVFVGAAFTFGIVCLFMAYRLLGSLKE